MSTFTNNPKNGLSNYSTNPATLSTCYTTYQQQGNQPIVNPGQEFQIPMTARDKVNNSFIKQYNFHKQI